MQSAISIGTLLQNHYRIVQLLGQGGFGRTYLAEDQGRFNERCAIKEFVPIKGEDKFSDKATQLFQREASVLYQIDHPQIPKFRATFEEEERLFLVQDYVEGPTFHEVLNQRRAQGRNFSEGEVRQFLKQLLPVLAHIHAKGIIHRDISSDNIILRKDDQLPVLIDFGVVKEVVTRMQMDPGVAQATTVGKAGYAPSEQLQTGRAYPSSDLYALAVTAIVLLTGREPQSLFDDINFAWQWQEFVQVTPEFAAVLNKALSYRPGDRYQSVSEMARALEASNRRATTSAAAAQSPNAVPPVSQMKTVAVGRSNPDATYSQSGPTINRPNTVRQSTSTYTTAKSAGSDQRSFLENPLAIGGLAAGLALTAGFGGWAVVRSLPNQGPTPTITSLPPLGSTEEPTAQPTLTQSPPKPVNYQQPQLDLTPGVTKVVEGNMRGGDTVNYPLVAEAGQRLNVSVAEDDVELSVLGPDGERVARNAQKTSQWEGELEEAGEYTIQLSTVRGVTSSDYRLEVALSEPPAPEVPDPVETLEPDPVETTEPDSPDEVPGEVPDEIPEPPAETPEPPIQPSVQSQRVSFPTGSDSIRVANNVSTGQIKRYIINAQEGQILTVRVLDSQNPVGFDLLMPGGEMVADAAGLRSWEGILPVGGDYSIDVKGDQLTEFTLEIRATAVIPTE
ncbi:MAG: serine/threonine-protein kinase [Cyanobacteria bacterium J06635_11]